MAFGDAKGAMLNWKGVWYFLDVLPDPWEGPSPCERCDLRDECAKDDWLATDLCGNNFTRSAYYRRAVPEDALRVEKEIRDVMGEYAEAPAGIQGLPSQVEG